MQILIDIIAFTGLLFIVNSLFYALFLVFHKKEKDLKKLLLAGLLISLSLRIFKSIIYFTFPETSIIFPALGLLGMSLVGPFLFLFISAMKGTSTDVRRTFLHFLFPLIVATGLILNSSLIFRIGYHLTVVQMFIYVLLSISFLQKKSFRKIQFEFLRNLNFVIGFIWITFFLQLIIPDITTYMVVTSTATLALFILTIQVLKNYRNLFVKVKLDDHQNPGLQAVRQRLKILLEDEKIYKYPDLDSKSLANRLQTKPYILSKVINEFYHKSIPELLSQYRVEHVKESLIANHNNLKIEAIAYESGFSSPSVFYREFKKHTSTTPKEFIQKHIAG